MALLVLSIMISLDVHIPDQYLELIVCLITSIAYNIEIEREPYTCANNI